MKNKNYAAGSATGVGLSREQVIDLMLEQDMLSMIGYRALLNGDSAAFNMDHLTQLANAALARATPQHSVTGRVRTKLLVNSNDDGDIGWYFDCDGHYIDVERDKDGKYSVFFRNRADGSEAWLDQADQPLASTAAQPEQAEEMQMFERDAEALGMPLERNGGHYLNIRTRNRWLGWQARAALAIPASTAAEQADDDFAHIAALSKATTRPYDPIYQVWDSGAGGWGDTHKKHFDSAQEKTRRIVYKPATSEQQAGADERALFQKWASGGAHVTLSHVFSFTMHPNQHRYLEGTTEICWRAWNAALACHAATEKCTGCDPAEGFCKDCRATTAADQQEQAGEQAQRAIGNRTWRGISLLHDATIEKAARAVESAGGDSAGYHANLVRALKTGAEKCGMSQEVKRNYCRTCGNLDFCTAACETEKARAAAPDIATTAEDPCDCCEDIRAAMAIHGDGPDAATAADQYTTQVGDDGEYELHRDGRPVGTILFRDDAERIMQALKATAADQQGDTASAAEQAKGALLPWSPHEPSPSAPVARIIAIENGFRIMVMYNKKMPLGSSYDLYFGPQDAAQAGDEYARGYKDGFLFSGEGHNADYTGETDGHGNNIDVTAYLASPEFAARVEHDRAAMAAPATTGGRNV